MNWIKKLWIKKSLIDYKQKEELEKVYNETFYQYIKKLTQEKAIKDAYEYMK